jgi:nucleoporin NUP2
MTASQTATSFTFGKPAEKSTEKSETASFSNPFGVPEKSTSSFFSTSKPSTTGGFSFGSSSSTSVFGKTESIPPAASAEDNTTEGENSERGTPAAEGDNVTPALLSSNPLDEEGAGEENEETVHTIKAKAFKLSKDAEGAAKWLQLGTGKFVMFEPLKTYEVLSRP